MGLPLAYLAVTNMRLLVPTLYLFIHALLGPLALAGLEHLRVDFPQLSFLPSMVVFLTIAFLILRLLVMR